MISQLLIGLGQRQLSGEIIFVNHQGVPKLDDGFAILLLLKILCATLEKLIPVDLWVALTGNQ
jgi:hypothetical protein